MITTISPNIKLTKIAAFVFFTIAPTYSFATDVFDQLFTSINSGSYTMATIGLRGASGSRDSSSSSVEINSSHTEKNHSWLFSLKNEDDKNNGVKSNESTQANLRYIQNITQQHNVEFFGQYYRDIFEGFDKQLNTGIGYHFSSIHQNTNPSNFSFGVGVIDEITEFTTNNELHVTRGNLYIARNSQFGKDNSSALSLSLLVKPLLSNLNNYRAISMLTLRSAITDMLSMNLQVKYSYDAAPEIGYKDVNTQYSSGISYTF